MHGRKLISVCNDVTYTLLESIQILKSCQTLKTGFYTSWWNGGRMFYDIIREFAHIRRRSHGESYQYSGLIIYNIKETKYIFTII